MFIKIYDTIVCASKADKKMRRKSDPCFEKKAQDFRHANAIDDIFLHDLTVRKRAF